MSSRVGGPDRCCLRAGASAAFAFDPGRVEPERFPVGVVVLAHQADVILMIPVADITSGVK